MMGGIEAAHHDQDLLLRRRHKRAKSAVSKIPCGSEEPASCAGASSRDAPPCREIAHDAAVDGVHWHRQKGAYGEDFEENGGASLGRSGEDILQQREAEPCASTVGNAVRLLVERGAVLTEGANAENVRQFLDDRGDDDARVEGAGIGRKSRPHSHQTELDETARKNAWLPRNGHAAKRLARLGPPRIETVDVGHCHERRQCAKKADKNPHDVRSA